jgi:cytochrome c553
MHKLIQWMTLACLIAPLSLAAQSSNVTLPQDKGPSKIDVSSYPAEQQKAYKLFEGKCSKCHTIARPINTTMTTSEWERYVKRMMHKPNSGISNSQGKDIFEFLAYDQKMRKDKNPSAFYKSLSDDEIEKLKAQQH